MSSSKLMSKNKETEKYDVVQKTNRLVKNRAPSFQHIEQKWLEIKV